MPDSEQISKIDKHSLSGVYFILAGTRVKIGESAAPRRRLRALQTASARDLLLVHVIPESDRHRRAQIEREMHKLFAPEHIRGEWFDYGAALYYASALCTHACSGASSETVDRFIAFRASGQGSGE